MFLKKDKKYFNMIGDSKVLIVDERNTGKTTILKYLIHFLNKKHKKMIVIDSATDHKTKSILCHVKDKYKNVYLLTSPEEENIENFYNWCINNIPKIMMEYDVLCFDVSKYLELGYDFEGQKRDEIRSLYKRLVYIFLLACDFLKLNYNIIADEIEYTVETINLLSKTTMPIISTIHNHLLNPYMKQGFSFVMDVNSFYDKCIYESTSNLIKCGELCCEYLLKLKNYINVISPSFWFSDICQNFNKYDIKCLVRYDNSNLMLDYYQNKLPIELTTKIKECCENNVVEKKKLNVNTFINEMKEKEYAILLVKSSQFHYNKHMTGGHYVIVQKKNEEYYIFSPQKSKLVMINMNLRKVISCCKHFGGFRLF